LEEKTLERLDDLKPLLEKFPVTWVDVLGLGNVDVIQKLGQIFGLHPLALEDSVNTHQRAKAEEYGDILFITARMISGPPLVTEQLSVFLGKRFVITLQGDIDGDSLESVRQRIRKGGTRLRTAGADYLLYELLDAVVDGYFPVVE